MEQHEPWSDDEDQTKKQNSAGSSAKKPPTGTSTAATRSAASGAPAPLNPARVTAPMPVAYDSAGNSTTSAAARRYNAPSPVVNTNGRSRGDFEAILASGADPSDEVRRTTEYHDWYYSQTPRDPRALAPLHGASSETPGRHNHHHNDFPSGSPGEGGKPPTGRRSGGGAPPNPAGAMKAAGGLSLDSGNFIPPSGGNGAVYAARGGINFNPYAANPVSAYSIPSPGTQFYAQFAAPSPMVGTPGGQAMMDMHLYAGTSPSAAAAAYAAAQQNAGSTSPPPGTASGASPEGADADAAALAAAQNALQQQPNLGMHHHHHHHAMYGAGGYPQHFHQYGGGYGATPYGYGGYGGGAGPQQLTPYPQQGGLGAGGVATHHHHHHQQQQQYYNDVMMGYGAGYGGYGGPQPSVNVGGSNMMGGHDMMGGYAERRPERGGRGGRGAGGDTRGGRGAGGGGRGGRGGMNGGMHNAAAAAQQNNGAAYVPRSELLERFRATMGTDEWKLDDIEGHAMEFARDQDGSRFIQRMLDSSPPVVVDRLFREIFSSPVELITDVFGNYVLQKLLEVGTHDQLLLVADSLRGQVVHLTLQTYGCRVVQKCIEVMPPRGLDVIIGELQGNVAKCIQDQNGNHVVQKCVEVVPDRCGFIVQAFTGRVKELATHAYGCRVIQCILQHCPAHEKEIFEELLQDIVSLTEDQYGNYVVQHVLQHASTAQCNAVFEKLKEHFYRFSVHKFASNVMERMFGRSNEAQRGIIIDQLTKEVEIGAQKEECADGKNRSPTQLFFMMKDQYANYVVQKLIDQCSDDHRRRLMISTQLYVPALRKYTFGKHMVARLERLKLLPLAATATNTPAASSATTAPASTAATA